MPSLAQEQTRSDSILRWHPLREGLPRLGSKSEFGQAREAVESGTSLPLHPLQKTILLVEDELAILRLAQQILRACGYSILAAPDGFEALQVAESHAGQIDLLLSDLRMPHLGGIELAERVKVLRPGIKVLFMSGYTEEVAALQEIAQEEVAFLPKPFTVSGLTQKVRTVLDER